MPVPRARIAQCPNCRVVFALQDGARTALTAPGPSAATHLSPGTKLRDRYRLVELIGEGPHGLTYRAHHEFLNHPCVVKVLPQRMADSSDGPARRLRNEASAGFRVNHPNVVRVLDGDVFDGTWYFVMEYIDGTDLGRVTEAGMTLAWAQVVRIGLDAARGLDAIHRAGIVHCDIKPGNLILGTDGRVRVSDLGVARLAGHQVRELSNPDGGRDGTLAYAAPEVFQTGYEPAPPADLYSLGAVLFELLTACRPRGGSVYQTMLGGNGQPVRWPEAGPPGIPAWLADGVLRLLEFSPSARFQSATDLLEYLERGTAQPAVGESPVADQERPAPLGLVVLPFESTVPAGADDWLGQAIADHLARALAQRGGLYVANAHEYLQTLERVRQRPRRSHMEQLLEAGRLVGAGTVIEGTFRRTGEAIELTARASRAGLSSSIEIEAVSGRLAALSELEAALDERLARRLDLPPAGNRLATRPAASNPAAEERFVSAKRAFFRGDYESAMTLGKEALRLGPALGEAIGFVGVCCTRLGRYDDAVAYHQQQLSLASRPGNERLKVEAHANLGSMHYFRGDFKAANECLSRAAQAAAEMGLATELASIQNNQGFVLLQLGQQAEAERTYLQAIDTLKRYGALVPLVGPYSGMGHVLRDQKRYAEASAYFQRALALAQESDDHVNMGIACMNLGQCALLEGRLDDAKRELATALSILEQTSFWNGLARVYEYMGDLNMRLSNWAEAMRCADKRIELAQRHSNARMEEAARRQWAQARRQAEDSAFRAGKA